MEKRTHYQRDVGGCESQVSRTICTLNFTRATPQLRYRGAKGALGMSLMDMKKAHAKNASHVETEKLMGNSLKGEPKGRAMKDKDECILSHILEKVRSTMEAENTIRKVECEVFPQGIACKPQCLALSEERT